MPDKGGGEAGLPSLHGGLQCGHMSLPAQELGDTSVSLQLLTSDVPLAALLGMSATTQLWAMVDR